LLADYHGNEALWRHVTDTWGNYLSAKGDKSPLPLLAAVISITDAGFEIPHRGILRTTWHQKVGHRLADVPRHEEYWKGVMIGSDTVIDHDSALVRIFARNPYGSFNNGVDIFIALYLRNLEGAKDMDFGWKRRDLQDSLDRENQRKKRRNKTKDEQ
jgi:hypothetical protein